MKQYHYYNGKYPTYSYMSTYIVYTIAYKISLLAGKYPIAVYWFNVMSTKAPKYEPKIINMQNHL
eukprot:3431455-Ditylum_brightwellii.AAC.1